MPDSVPNGDIPSFVMYCVNGASGSSLLIESTDSMIYITVYSFSYICIYTITLDKVSLSLICTRQELVAWE